MATFTFPDIEMALLYISLGSYGTNSVVIRKDTGEILHRSSMAGIDEISEAEDLNWDQCVEMPHKNDFGLGNELVFEFVEEHLPNDYEKVCQMFRHSGAYSRYKALLEERGMLQEWYDVENSREERALRNWCQENGIELDG